MRNWKDHILTYFIDHWGMWEYTRGWLKGDCPYCGAEQKFGVHVGTNRVHCFKCDTHASPLATIAYIEDLTIPEARAIIYTFQGLKYHEEKAVEYERKHVNFPEGYQLLTQGRGQVAKSARAYIEKKRGLDVKALALKGFGYCDSGPLFGYIIMPFYFRGELVYYQTRNFLANGPKFNNPKIEDFGIGKSSLVYNVDSLWVYESTHIVESVFNAETIGDNAIAIAGKSISRYQLNTIISSPVKRINILLDPDAYYEKAIPLALTLSLHKQVKLVNLPDNQDVNSYGRTRTMLLKRKTIPQTYNQLLNLKHEYERTQLTY